MSDDNMVHVWGFPDGDVVPSGARWCDVGGDLPVIYHRDPIRIAGLAEAFEGCDEWYCGTCGEHTSGGEA